MSYVTQETATMAMERMTLLARIEDAARSEEPDVFREALEWAMQRLIEDDVTERLGAVGMTP